MDSDPNVGPYRNLDFSIYPSGSTCSLRYDIPNGLGERSDDWRISIDNYTDQFDQGQEFWVQWRMRMDPTYATFAYLDRYSGAPTGWKCLFINAGMQYPYVVNYTNAAMTDYGYGRYDGKTNPPVGTPSQSSNVMYDALIDAIPEIVMRDKTEMPTNATIPATFKQPWMYIGKGYNNDTTQYSGQLNKSTLRNGGSESYPFPNATAWYQYRTGIGDVYDDWTQSFVFPANSWFSMMVHVVLGPYGSAVDSLSGARLTGYTNSTVEWYGALEGSTQFSLIHRRSGVVLPVDQSTPQGAQGRQRYGQFGFTTFMTNKSLTQTCPPASVWFSQVIISSGPVAPAPPL